ncbi:MAG: T9SS type A sorting domain-containing protein [Bacteroidetes bacterium]|nr:T9SS type A sorting domain-containing protein [Bacteroidota bacterium]
MLRIPFFLLMWLLPFAAMAQFITPLDVTTNYNPSPVSGWNVTATCEDTIRNVLFTARYQPSSANGWDIRKTNLTTGVTTTLLVNTISSNVPIPTPKIAFKTNRLYFSQKTPSLNNQRITCIDTAGNVIWFRDFLENSTDSIFDYSLSHTGDTLFVAGSFSISTPISISFLAAFNANTGQLLTGWTHSIGASAGNFVRTVLVEGGSLYVGGDFLDGSAQHLTKYTLTSSGPVRVLTWNPNPNAAVYDIASINGNFIAVGGEFTAFSVTTTRNYFAYLNKNTGALLSTSLLFNAPVRKIETYPGNVSTTPFVFIAGDFTAINTTSRNHFVGYTYPASLLTWDPGIANYNSEIRLVRFRNHLYISAAKRNILPSPYKVYCLAAPQPSLISYSSTAFCRGGNPITASVSPVQYATSYNWSYSGSGVTLVPSGNAVQLIFGLNATGGTLTVSAQSDCGLQSALRSSVITLLPSPTVNAGLNDSLTCIHTSVLLNGFSTTPGATLVWTFPNSMQFPDSVITSDPGQYILTATSPNQCMWRDTMQVIVDTVRPALQPFGFVQDLTCSADSVILDAATLYPADSLRWTSIQGVFPNPFAATVSGNYLLTIHSRRNGCENSDTIFVNENITPPPVLLPASIDTLTCLQTSVQLNSPPVTGGVQVWNLVGDTVFVNNPATVSVPGNYILTTTSLINGCLSQGVVNVNQFITPPNVTVPANVPVLNCSFDSVSIDGSSANIGAGLWWTGPGNFSSADPAVVTQQGVYVLTVTHPQNGCTRSDSITVNYVNTLTVIANTDTTICPGSGAVLTASPVGGTPGFSISWDNNGGSGSPVTVYPADSLTYIVTINDNAGCVGTDTVRVHVPDVLSDSTLSFQPCDPLQPTGQVQVYAWGGVPPYQFSIDGGSTFQNSGVFGNLGYGNYSFIIRDTLGCTRSTSAVIDTNSLSPAPDFLLSTNPDMGDTVVIVDISNPRPDSVNWIFPPSVTVIDSNQFAPVILYGDTGIISITMQAYYGSCEVNYVRNVIIGPFVPGGATPWNNNGIDTLIVYPNPNNGTFTVDLELHAEQTFIIQVFDASGIERFRMPPLTTNSWTGSITIPAALPGNYQLRVTAEFDSESRIIIVTQ